MKRRFMFMGTALLLSSSILFSSCIGSFSLFNKVLAWNKSLGDKWVNELVFLACCIVPIYPISWFIDSVILNSIEFWTGDNPVAETTVKTVETENGKFTITSDASGHKIQKDGTDEVVEFKFNAENNGWDLVVADEVSPVLQFEENNQAKVFLADGNTMTVSLDEAGMMAFRKVVETNAYFAQK